MADCVYVNFSVERLAEPWLHHLAYDGRFVFPLGVQRPTRNLKTGRHALHVAAFCVERQGGDGAFPVQWLGPAFFVCAEVGEGTMLGTDAEREALKGAFERGGVEFVRPLH